MAAPNVGELIATTWWKQGKSVADNISHNVLLWRKLNQKGRNKMVDGGYEIREPLSYGENGTFGWYNGYMPLAVRPQQNTDVAKYTGKQASVAITLSGRERLINRSDAELVDLLDVRMENAEKSMTNQLSNGLYSDGTGYGGLQLQGLQTLIVADPTTGEAGKISRSSNPWWRNQVVDKQITAANIVGAFNELYAKMQRNGDRPDLIVLDNEMWQLYVGVLQAQQRFVSTDKKANKGFAATEYLGVDIILDGGHEGGMPASRAYFLNLANLALKTYTGANMEPAPGGARRPVDQDSEVHHILWMGALCCSNMFLQGVIEGS